MRFRERPPISCEDRRRIVYDEMIAGFISSIPAAEGSWEASALDGGVMSEGTDHRSTRSNGRARQDGEWPQARRRIDPTEAAIRQSRALIEESMLHPGR